jgi:hypothetical protein
MYCSLFQSITWFVSEFELQFQFQLPKSNTLHHELLRRHILIAQSRDTDLTVASVGNRGLVLSAGGPGSDRCCAAPARSPCHGAALPRLVRHSSGRTIAIRKSKMRVSVRELVGSSYQSGTKIVRSFSLYWCRHADLNDKAQQLPGPTRDWLRTMYRFVYSWLLSHRWQR